MYRCSRRLHGSYSLQKQKGRWFMKLYPPSIVKGFDYFDWSNRLLPMTAPDERSAESIGKLLLLSFVRSELPRFYSPPRSSRCASLLMPLRCVIKANNYGYGKESEADLSRFASLFIWYDRIWRKIVIVRIQPRSTGPSNFLHIAAVLFIRRWTSLETNARGTN